MKRPMVYTRPRVGIAWLLAAVAILLAGFSFAQWGAGLERNPWYPQQLAAARRMQQAERVLRNHILREGIPIEPEDINQTGLIGPEMTVLTTSLGLLEAKRTSLNPDMAALVVSFFEQLGLKAGDKVALGISGSFPGLAIAALSAATQMRLEARCIVSYGASTYGATRPELTVTRMMAVLKEAQLVDYALLAVSMGGDNDQGGGGLYEDTRQVMLSLAEADRAPVIDLPDLAESIQRRLTLFGEDVACFVNIGGATANIGQGMHSLDFPPGLVVKPPAIPNLPTQGLIFEYAARGVPVVHLLNLRKLTMDHGLPFDPVPLPEPGEGAVYHRRARRPWAQGGTLALALLTLALGRRAHGQRQKM